MFMQFVFIGWQVVYFFICSIDPTFTGEEKSFKSTNHRPTDHLRTDQPSHRSPTHRPTGSKFTDPLTRFYFKDLIIKKHLFCRAQTQLGKYKTIIRSI